MACILPKDIEILTAKIERTGLANLRAMKSSERVNFFYEFLTENMKKGSFNEKKMRADAEMYAARLEKQLLKPAEMDAAETWAATAKSPAGKKDILQMINDSSEILQANNKDYLDALVRRKLGFSLNTEQTTELLKIANEANELHKTFVGKYENFDRDYNDQTDFSKERFDLSKKLYEFKNKFNEYKLENERRDDNKAQKALYWLAGNWKALRASFDLSFGRQLATAFYAGEKGTRAAWKTGIKTFWDSIVRPEKVAQLEAMLLTRKNALNGNYSKFGLDLGMNEEAYPENAVSKIPVAGKFIEASDQSYRIALQTARANIFDARFDMAMKDMNNDQGAVVRLFEEGEIGKYINSITGRGDVRGLLSEQGQRKVNYLLFSPKFLAARIERITDMFGYGWRYFGDKNDVRVMRGRAAMNQFVFSFALAVALRAAFDDDDDWLKNVMHPLSGGFMQGEILNTRVDTSFGQGGVMRDVARAIMGQTRTEEGVVVDRASTKTIGSFFMGKASPFADGMVKGGQLVGYMLGIRDKLPTNFAGEEMGWEHLVGAVLPITPVNARDVIYQDGEFGFHADSLFGITLETLGVNTRIETQDKKKPGLSADVVREQGKIARATQKQSPGTVLASNSSIMTKLSGAKRDRAVADFERDFNREMGNFIRSGKYSRMTAAERDAEQRKIRTKVQTDLKKKYGIK